MMMVVLLTALTAPVMAQQEGAPADKPWLTSVVAVLLAGFVIAASIKNAKRGHRD